MRRISLLFFLLALPAAADVVVVSSAYGDRTSEFVGEVVEIEDRVLVLSEDTSREFQRGQIAEIRREESTRTPEQRYAQFRKAYGDRPAQLCHLGLWCRQHNLPDQANECFLAAIERQFMQELVPIVRFPSEWLDAPEHADEVLQIERHGRVLNAEGYYVPQPSIVLEFRDIEKMVSVEQVGRGIAQAEAFLLKYPTSRYYRAKVETILAELQARLEFMLTGPIANRRVLSPKDRPYYMVDDLVVEPEGRLVLEAGVHLTCRPTYRESVPPPEARESARRGKRILLGGQLLIQGTPERPVVVDVGIEVDKPWGSRSGVPAIHATSSDFLQQVLARPGLDNGDFDDCVFQEGLHIGPSGKDVEIDDCIGLAQLQVGPGKVEVTRSTLFEMTFTCEKDAREAMARDCWVIGSLNVRVGGKVTISQCRVSADDKAVGFAALMGFPGSLLFDKGRITCRDLTANGFSKTSGATLNVKRSNLEVWKFTPYATEPNYCRLLSCSWSGETLDYSSNKWPDRFQWKPVAKNPISGADVSANTVGRALERLLRMSRDQQNAVLRILSAHVPRAVVIPAVEGDAAAKRRAEAEAWFTWWEETGKDLFKEASK